MKKVKDYMSRRVAYVTPYDTIFKAAKIFSKREISGAPVVKSSTNKEIIGVISESDIVKFMGIGLCNLKSVLGDISQFSIWLMFAQFISLGKDQIKIKKSMEKLSKIEVKDVMSKRVVSVSPETSVFEAAQMMENRHINRLPVVKDKKLVGIIARADLIRALCD